MTLRDIQKKLVFLAGDMHREHSPFGFAWGHYPHAITYDEAYHSILYAQEGYVGLHRTIGELSNVAIRGAFTHAWLYLGGTDIMEAVSEGVLRRSFLYPTMSDYVVILKPLVSLDARHEAVQRALLMEGCPYDDRFQFDLEIEDGLFADKQTALANMRQYGLGLTCSEMVALCYVGHRRELGLYRVRHGNREIILPDQFMSTHFEVTWASQSARPELLNPLGLSEEGSVMLDEYWKNNRRR